MKGGYKWIVNNIQQAYNEIVGKIKGSKLSIYKTKHLWYNVNTKKKKGVKTWISESQVLLLLL